MKESYSKLLKNEILSEVPKKKCCQRMRSDALALQSIADPAERAAKIAASPTHFRCPACPASFAAGLFLVCGSVTDPDKQYHLELSFLTDAERDAAATVLSEVGMKRGQRKAHYLLYLKSSSAIEDFLTLIGATRASLDLMNARIVREVWGDANRQRNCDMANINKSLAAAEHYTEAIRKLFERGLHPRLPKELLETATLRMENTQASMTELGRLHVPPISKSGVKHRLDKLLQLSEEWTK